MIAEYHIECAYGRIPLNNLCSQTFLDLNNSLFYVITIVLIVS